MSSLEELLPEFRKGAKIRIKKWEKGNYYVLKNGEVVNQDNEKIVRFYPEAILIDQWELYQEPEPDWNSIIKNKCLCWFWDNYAHIGYCTKQGTVKNLFLDSNDDVSFIDENDNKWKNCRPVRRDEVTFYEEKKDE